MIKNTASNTRAADDHKYCIWLYWLPGAAWAAWAALDTTALPIKNRHLLTAFAYHIQPHFLPVVAGFCVELHSWKLDQDSAFALFQARPPSRLLLP